MIIANTQIGVNHVLTIFYAEGWNVWFSLLAVGCGDVIYMMLNIISACFVCAYVKMYALLLECVA